MPLFFTIQRVRELEDYNSIYLLSQRTQDVFCSYVLSRSLLIVETETKFLRYIANKTRFEASVANMVSLKRFNPDNYFSFLLFCTHIDPYLGALYQAIEPEINKGRTYCSLISNACNFASYADAHLILYTSVCVLAIFVIPI